MSLTSRRELFVQEYLKDLNATQAAQRAGYARLDEGSRLLADPEVQQRVAELKQERAKRLEIDADKALLALQQIIEMNPDAVEKLRYADKLKAIELCLRHLGLLAPEAKVEVNTQVDIGMAERIIAARQRAGAAAE